MDYKLIPEQQRWLRRKHGYVDFYLTQLLTGHGCLKHYLNRFKHEHYQYTGFLYSRDSKIAAQQQVEALRTNVPGNRDEITRTHTRATVHLPKFAHSNPQLWFAQVERSFRLHQIIDDTDKFDLVTLHLEEDVDLAVEDLVIRPPNENKYVAIKNRLLQNLRNLQSRNCADFCRVEVHLV